VEFALPIKRSCLLDKDFFHGCDGRSETVDAEFLSVLLEYIEQLLEARTALVRQQIVKLGTHTPFLLQVGHELANDARDVLLLALAVLHQSQVVADPFTHARVQTVTAHSSSESDQH